MYSMICIIDQERGQDSWILAIGHCIFMDRDEIKVNKNAKRIRAISSIPTKEAWSMKDLLYGPKADFFLQDQCRKS